MQDTITTAQIFSLLDSLEASRSMRLYRVTMIDGLTSTVVARDLRDCGVRVREITSKKILGIVEVPTGDFS